MENFSANRCIEQVTLDKAYTKAQEVLLRNRIKESDFTDVYSTEEINRDVDTIARLKQKFELNQVTRDKTAKMLATVLEAIVLEQGELSNWFGQNGHIADVSEFDDFINGIDMVVEFSNPDNLKEPRLTLGIDVTIASDITAKFDRIKEQIEDDELATMKYYSSEGVGVHGERKKMPKVIIGVSGETVRDLMELWPGTDKDKLASHKIQIIMLTEIKDQLIAFIAYAKLHNHTDLVGIYESRLQIIERILLSKIKPNNGINLEIKDDIFSMITSYIRRWNKIIDDKMKTKEKLQQYTIPGLAQSDNGNISKNI